MLPWEQCSKELFSLGHKTGRNISLQETTSYNYYTIPVDWSSISIAGKRPFGDESTRLRDEIVLRLYRGGNGDGPNEEVEGGKVTPVKRGRDDSKGSLLFIQFNWKCLRHVQRY